MFLETDADAVIVTRLAEDAAGLAQEPDPVRLENTELPDNLLRATNSCRASGTSKNRLYKIDAVQTSSSQNKQPRAWTQ